MIDNLIILLLIVGAFLGGLALAGHYYKRLIDEWRYTCKILAADKGVGYIAPPEDPAFPLGSDFFEKLRENGRATKALRTPHT